MNATLELKVVGGTNRGGEDVVLLVRLESYTEPGEALSEEAFEALKAQVRADYGDSDDYGDVWLCDDGDGEVVRTETSCRYEFRVEQSTDTLFADLKKLFEGGDWNFNRQRKVWWVQEELYRNGNAD
jgi:hypothetical protein